MPMISTSSGGSSCLSTSSESAICGMALGETNDTASICLNPAPISARRYWTFMGAGIWPLRPCQASRGHSMILTSLFAIIRSYTSNKIIFNAEARRRGVKNLSDNPVSQNRNIEIDDEPNRFVEQLQVGKQLGFMDSEDAFNALQFEDYSILDNQIKPVAAIKRDTFVNDRNGNLPLKM